MVSSSQRSIFQPPQAAAKLRCCTPASYAGSISPLCLVSSAQIHRRYGRPKSSSPTSPWQLRGLRRLSSSKVVKVVEFVEIAIVIQAGKREVVVVEEVVALSGLAEASLGSGSMVCLAQANRILPSFLSFFHLATFGCTAATVKLNTALNVNHPTTSTSACACQGKAVALNPVTM